MDQSSAPVLLTPGPTPVPRAVAAALAAPLQYHESSEFRVAFREAVELLKRLHRTEREPAVASSSITGACASVFANLTRWRIGAIGHVESGDVDRAFAGLSRLLAEHDHRAPTPSVAIP